MEHFRKKSINWSCSLCQRKHINLLIFPLDLYNMGGKVKIWCSLFKISKLCSLECVDLTLKSVSGLFAWSWTGLSFVLSVFPHLHKFPPFLYFHIFWPQIQLYEPSECWNSCFATQFVTLTGSSHRYFEILYNPVVEGVTSFIFTNITMKHS